MSTFLSVLCFAYVIVYMRAFGSLFCCAFVPKNNQYSVSNTTQFSDYTFTADDLPAFRYYRIKLLLTGTNQGCVPRIKDLRVMALA